MDKKKEQLGMNPSTASHRLVKDLLWKFICDTGNNECYHCKKPMIRDDFSIEHKIPWLDSEDPVGLFFSLENISFSHLSCNSSKSRVPNKGKGQTREQINEKKRRWYKDKYYNDEFFKEREKQRKREYMRDYMRKYRAS